MELARPAIDTDILTERLATMLRAGRTAAARPLLLALKRLQPGTPGLAQLEARLLLAEGRAGEALAELDPAIAASPDDASLRKCRAEVRVELGDIALAADDVAHAVILDPGDSGAKKMLGVLLVTLDRAPDAIACLSEALADDPRHASHYRGLAMAQDRLGAPEQAAATLALGIAACPADIRLRDAAMLLALHRRDYSEVLDLAARGRADGCVSATGFALLGHALASLGRHDEAADSYGEAQKLAPGDTQIRQLVATSSLHRDGVRASTAQIRGIFDSYAERFESHIIALGYRIPGLVRAALMEHLPAIGPAPALLDLGCGTGLVAVAVADLAGPITGVDLSPAMLAAARAKNLYADLIEADLLDWLTGEQQSWKVIVAADVLIYFGALDAVLAAVRARLTPDGLFLFSLEEHLVVGDGDSSDWALGRLGRFGHDAAYVARALQAAGFARCSMTPQVQRQEGGAGVPGWLVAARPA